MVFMILLTFQTQTETERFRTQKLLTEFCTLKGGSNETKEKNNRTKKGSSILFKSLIFEGLIGIHE